MKRRLIAVALAAFVAAFGISVNWDYGDLRWSVFNHTLRHWHVVLAGKPACAAGFYFTHGPCGGVVTGSSYVFTGDHSGKINAASNNFTVQGVNLASVTITPSDSSHGGIFSPTSVTISGSNAGAFTYTPLQAGTYNLATTNNDSLTNPSPISYTVPNLLQSYPGFTSPWATSAASATTGQPDPFGGSNATLITEDTSNAYHFFGDDTPVSVTSGQLYTYGIMIKAATGTRSLDWYIAASGSFNSGADLVINPATCTITSSGGFGGTVIGATTTRTTGLATGWCLATLQFTPNFTSASERTFLNSGGNDVYTGDGASGLYLYGAFLE